MEKIARIFDSKLFDAVLVTGEANKRYFTDFVSQNSYLLLLPDRAVFFLDKRYTEAAAETFCESPRGRIDIVDITNLDRLGSVLAFALNGAPRSKRFKKLRLGFEEDGVSYSEYSALKKYGEIRLIPAGKLIEGLRQVKEPEEIERIARAAAIAEEAYNRVLPLIKEGVAEKDIADELIYRMRKAGADDVSFDPIVAFAENTSKPHHAYGEKKLENNAAVTIDLGAKYKGYCSDMTRSFFFGARPDPDYTRIYRAVLEAQNDVLVFLKAGVLGCDADALARETIESRGFGQYFSHALGHSVGLEIHEEPRLSKCFTGALVRGNVVTVEPGVYLPGKFGVRTEDMVLITEEGIENFCKLGKAMTLDRNGNFK